MLTAVQSATGVKAARLVQALQEAHVLSQRLLKLVDSQIALLL
jgi:hypothetical protein